MKKKLFCIWKLITISCETLKRLNDKTISYYYLKFLGSLQTQ